MGDVRYMLLLWCELLITFPSFVKWIPNDFAIHIIHAQKGSPTWVYAYLQCWLKLSCTLESLRITPIKYSILDQYKSQLNKLCMLLVVQQQTASKGFSPRFKCFVREAHEAFRIFTYWAKHLKHSEKPLLWEKCRSC